MLRKLILSHDRMFLIQAWLVGLLDFSGELERAIDFMEYLFNYPLSPLLAAKACLAALHLPAIDRSVMPSSKALAFEEPTGKLPELRRKVMNIRHHYDNGQAFYKLFLDPLLVYSCAHFESPAMDLCEAQMAKLDLICRKLLLKSGERLLDVGCGWGALLFYAAERYGVTADGITLSPDQYEYCKRQINERGLSGRVTVHLLDYKEITNLPNYDKMVSVGMLEHVGLKNYAEYFSILLKALSPGGLFLCHAIMTQDESDSHNFSSQFIQRYVFPGACIANLPDTLAAAQRNGWEIVDVDAWRPHYAKTLRCWVENLLANQMHARELIGDAKVRLWLLFMLCSARGFENNYLGINQILLRRRDDTPWDLPIQRAWLI
ncbi:MAG TPA: class I SAM-dependent methyltransferase [Candidatus Obscuribacterales bacterium]